MTIKPAIKKLDFSSKGKMAVYLNDGRIIYIPIKFFPSIKNLDLKKRTKWYVLNGDMFSFDDCKEVFHIEQVLGKEKDYAYKFS
ncbi:MAG: hypothetical protein NT007_10210 [Candidatus Kapabacteria bacterium]|nr:hypothetical protein [Candidatus Kapabacteria bacterium]